MTGSVGLGQGMDVKAHRRCSGGGIALRAACSGIANTREHTHTHLRHSTLPGRWSGHTLPHREARVSNVGSP